jgi:hypothetical protein
MPFNKLPLLAPKPCAELVEASVWEHNCRETEFLVHYTHKQEFGSEQLEDIFQKATLLQNLQFCLSSTQQQYFS